MLVYKQNCIIADGRHINIEINREEIKTRVMKKYANELLKSGLVNKIKIYIMIKLEIRKEIAKVAPIKGLYLKR
ncbi:hypothetical protein JMF89_10445 [Clostridiaceae bacterium UIB06]|uniref:Uncharacterized protein n=1 Tax=Clostridium thailandense TaxID=2794346 RepID=A0A949TM39_9CLOT|nr:hypothetical protein [Clostridium thailandense]MBV7274875.1 hypothetical protein [Clostridium thailandense]MCH5137620.1 hypothetical protein [Clostridiaceae bacterium UIB06]